MNTKFIFCLGFTVTIFCYPLNILANADTTVNQKTITYSATSTPVSQIIINTPATTPKDWWEDAIVPAISAVISGIIAVIGISMASTRSDKSEVKKQLLTERLKLYVGMTDALKDGINVIDATERRGEFLSSGIIDNNFNRQLDYLRAYQSLTTYRSWVNGFLPLGTYELLASKQVKSSYEKVNELQINHLRQMNSDNDCLRIGIANKQAMYDLVISLVNEIKKDIKQ